jgi:hypothetical protein
MGFEQHPVNALVLDPGRGEAETSGSAHLGDVTGRVSYSSLSRASADPMGGLIRRIHPIFECTQGESP